jgi:hypothetical protein
MLRRGKFLDLSTGGSPKASQQRICKPLVPRSRGDRRSRRLLPKLIAHDSHMSDPRAALAQCADVEIGEEIIWKCQSPRPRSARTSII